MDARTGNRKRCKALGAGEKEKRKLATAREELPTAVLMMMREGREGETDAGPKGNVKR